MIRTRPILIGSVFLTLLRAALGDLAGVNITTAQACCGDDHPAPSPAEMQFVFDARNEGFPGLDGKDMKLISVGLMICEALWVYPNHDLQSQWTVVNRLLGVAPMGPQGPSRNQINDMVRYARDDLCPHAPPWS